MTDDRLREAAQAVVDADRRGPYPEQSMRDFALTMDQLIDELRAALAPDPRPAALDLAAHDLCQLKCGHDGAHDMTAKGRQNWSKRREAIQQEDISA